MKKNTLLLVDGNALLHRAFHGLPPMTTRNGEHTNAIYGFLTIFFKALAEIKPELAIVCWDEGKTTFRHKKFKEYKAQRVKQVDELYQQLAKIREIMTAFDIPNFSDAGYEADDLIGTISHQAEANNLDTVILTGDLDALQLVSDRTKVYTMKRGISDSIIYDKIAVAERYGGLSPDQLIEYKALRGDPSDNIPGLPGIGEKTAIDLLQKYGSIAKIYANLDKLPDKIKTVFEQSNDLVEANLELVTIVCDMTIALDLDKARLKRYDREKVARIFQELEFKTLLSRLPIFAGGNTTAEGLFAETKPDGKPKVISKNYHLVEDIDEFIRKLSAQKEFCFDTESETLGGSLLGISFAWQENDAYYLPVVSEGGYRQKMPREKILAKLKPIFENPKIAKIGQNLKYDYKIMKNYDIEVCPLAFDTMIASYVLHPHYNSHSLDSLAFTELGYETVALSDLFATENGKKGKIGNLKTLPIEALYQYSSEDADITLKLANKFRQELKDNPQLLDLFTKIEMPLAKVLAEMERTGIKIDSNFFDKLSQQMHQEIDDLTTKIYQVAGIKFNINSTVQLKEVLFKHLKIDTKDIKKTKTSISTAASELEKLRGHHVIIDLIFRYRELSKLVSTYVDALPKLADSSGRVHTSFNQTLTSTGRLSSTEPNLQNIPARTDEGRQIRRAFVADKNKLLISVDYSQIELRIAAALSKDKEMTSSFAAGEDFHSATAAEVAGVPIAQVTKEMRFAAKAINFGMIYGQSAHGLSQATKMSREEATNYIDKYFLLYHELKKFLDGQIEKARETGYVETMFGRRRYIPEINSGIFAVRSAAERTALNTPIQGTAADILKMAMVEVYDELITRKYQGKSKLLLTVHDELVFEVQKEIAPEFSKDAKKIMENVADIGVPIVAEVKVGGNWEEMKALPSS